MNHRCIYCRNPECDCDCHRLDRTNNVVLTGIFCFVVVGATVAYHLTREPESHNTPSASVETASTCACQ